MTHKLKIEGTELTSPFTSGSGGSHFENQVQSVFVVLMLTGGVVPCVPSWPISKIKLQGKYEGYETDDLIVFVEGSAGRKAKLLAQIRHVAAVTESDTAFGTAIAAAWRDFNDDKTFDPFADSIALVTGPLSSTDSEARTILEWARHSATAEEFFYKVGLAIFSSDIKRAKLRAFREQLKKANSGVDIDGNKLWTFLKSYHILGYDLDIKSGVTLSLLHSHIAQFACEDIPAVWAEISREIAAFNQNAGTITRETVSRAIREKLSIRVSRVEMPEDLTRGPQAQSLEALAGDRGTAVMFASLLGSCDERNVADMDAAKKLIE